VIAKYYKFINYGTLILVILLGALMLLNIVPKTMFVTLLWIAIVLLLIRVIARILLMRYNKNLKKGE
jgi:NhaP-type Na+/H+ or K+/H+ antiporter